MNLEEKVDQLLIFGFTRKPQWPTGGLILFEHNITNVMDLKRKCACYHRTGTLPPLIAVDQEGGRVNRIKTGVSLLPSNGLLGMIGSEQTLFRCGQLLAKELIPLGIDLNLAPVVDVNTEEKNPIIGDRSFGRNPTTVARYGKSLIRGMRQGGLLVCAKHFPGHGAAKKDSHLCLPKINISRGTWEKIHLLPFKKAIEAGVEFIMVAHILCPALDDKNPASLSRRVITELLQERLGYRGIIITDDLAMAAVTKNYEIGEAAVGAIRAGADMIICSHNLERQKKIRRALLQAFRNGVLAEKRLDISLAKIIKLKKKHFGLRGNWS